MLFGCPLPVDVAVIISMPGWFLCVLVFCCNVFMRCLCVLCRAVNLVDVFESDAFVFMVFEL